jgi:hypothetical protein
MLMKSLTKKNIPPLWSSGQEFLAADPEVRVQFPALPDFGTNITDKRRSL